MTMIRGFERDASTGALLVSGDGGSVTTIRCTVVLTADFSVANLTGVPVRWDADAGARGYNVGGAWSASNPERFTAPSDGLYFLGASVWWDEGSSVGERALRFNFNGGGRQGLVSENRAMDATNGRLQNIAGIVFLRAGEFLTIEAFQDSGTTRTLARDQYGADFDVGRATFARIGG